MEGSDMLRRFLILLLTVTMIPYVTTLAWTGREGGIFIEREVGEDSGSDLWMDLEQFSDLENAYRVMIQKNEKEQSVSVESFLIPVLAAQIPAEFEPETLKAQAILARTYVYGLMNGRSEIYEEELDMDALSTDQMRKLWGEKDYAKMLGRLQDAVRQTAGMYAIYDGTIIEPFFCYASAGKTRSMGDSRPYLRQVDSAVDQNAENYRSFPVFELREFVSQINEIPGAVEVQTEELADGEGIQIVERDSAGYVKYIQIGQKTYTGEEVQYALGLASSCYSFERIGGKIRAICKGIGHGYGFSQYGANEMAKEGKTYVELLDYYFQNLELVAANLESGT